MNKEDEKSEKETIGEKFNKRVDRIYEQKEHKKICGVSGWRILGYIVIYGFLGYLIEVIYGIATKGVIESRQSFLYGPFCSIYGIGAVLMILPMNKLNSKNKIADFFLSAFIGCSVEYIVSWVGEVFLHSKWWDYSDYFLNINGRVCLYFGIFWGLLGLALKYVINPRIDSLIDKIKIRSSRRKQYIVVLLTNFFLISDCVLSIVAMDLFQARAVHDKKIDSVDVAYYEERYDFLYKNENFKRIVELLWNDETMLKTYPNVKFTRSDGEVDYYANYYPDIQTYYFKVFDIDIKTNNPVYKMEEK